MAEEALEPVERMGSMGLRNRRKCGKHHPPCQDDSDSAQERDGSSTNTKEEDEAIKSEVSTEPIESGNSEQLSDNESDQESRVEHPVGDEIDDSSRQVPEEIPRVVARHNEISVEPDESHELDQVPELEVESDQQIEARHPEISLEAIESEELEQVSKILNELQQQQEQEQEEQEREEEQGDEKDEREKSQAGRVYKMPDNVDSGYDNNSLVFWPANFVILAVAWQLRIIFVACSGIVSMLSFVYGFVLDPLQKTADVKQTVSDRINSVTRPLSADVFPKVAGWVRRVGWGVLAVVYVVLMLGFLVVPVVLVEYFYVAKLVETPVDIKAPIFFDYTEARPSAEFRFGPEAGNGNLDESLSLKPFSWEKLHIGVALTLPESDYNRQLGMFQVAAEIFAPRNHLLRRSTRPCMLRFQSVPIRYVRTIIYSVPVLLDVAGEYQILELDLMLLRNDARSRSRPIQLSAVKIILEPRAGFGAGAGLPELYSAEIRVRAELPWRKSLLYKWKLTIYVWSAMAMFVVEVGVVLCCFRQLLVPRRSRRHQIKVSDQTGTATPRRARSQAKKRVSFEN